MTVLRGILVAALALVGAAVWWFWPETVDVARFGSSACRVVDVATPDGLLVGAEDVTLAGGTLYISAHDREAVDEAVAAGRRPPDGGLYAMQLSALSEPAPVASRLIDPTSLPNGLRPHGIFAEQGRLGIVNRAYVGGDLEPEILVYDIGGDPVQQTHRLRPSGLCAANDVTLSGETLFVTLDRQICPGVSWSEMLFSPDGGRLIQLDLSDDATPETAMSGLTFANGVIATPDGPVVAETRGRQLRIGATALPVPGAPDNLTLSADGRIVAALHPSLLRLALLRAGWLSAAPSRIAAIDPATGHADILYDDPSGHFSAATAAVLTENGLVAGSALDLGLLVCGTVK